MKDHLARMGLIVAILTLLASFFVPEVRQFIGLEPRPGVQADETTTGNKTSDTTILYEENFEDGIANGWAETYGNWNVINDGTGNMALSTSDQRSGINISAGKDWDNYKQSFKYRFKNVSNSSNFLVWTRRLDEAQYYELVIGQDFYDIWKYVNGSGTDFNNGKYSASFNSSNLWHTVMIEANGNTLRWQIDENEPFEVNDKSHLMGTVGFGTYNFNGQVLIDDIYIWSLLDRNSSE